MKKTILSLSMLFALGGSLNAAPLDPRDNNLEAKVEKTLS